MPSEDFDRIVNRLRGNDLPEEDETEIPPGFFSAPMVLAGTIVGAIIAAALRIAGGGLGVLIASTAIDKLVNAPDNYWAAVQLVGGSLLIWLLWPLRSRPHL